MLRGKNENDVELFAKYSSCSGNAADEKCPILKLS